MSRCHVLINISKEFSVVFGHPLMHNRTRVYRDAMTSNQKDAAADEFDHRPVAHIHAQDPTFIEPLREYLSRHGCLTIVNSPTDQKITYCIVAGDNEYVKDIIADTNYIGVKTLAILYEGGEDDVNLYLSKHINIALIDPVLLDEEKLRSLLLLLFTGSSRSLINRKAKKSASPKSVISTPPRREPYKTVSEDTTDEARVSDIMKQVFKSKISSTKSNSKTLVKKIKVGSLLFISTLFVVALSYISSILMAGVGLYFCANLLVSSNVRLATYGFRMVDAGIQTADMFVRFMAPSMKLIGFEKPIEDQERIVSLLSNILSAEKNALTIFVSGKDVISGIVRTSEDKGSPISLSDVIALRSEVIQLDQSLALVQTELGTLLQINHIFYSIPTLRSFAQQTLMRVENVRSKLSYFDRLFTIYPQVSGYRKKQTYLVLLQNSMELRPTGGFIGSIALVTFLDGKVSDLSVEDVYTADGQLKGHIDPPLAIRELLGQEHWYLRDSNWDPNFIQSGAQAAWFYEKEMGVSVDGVIAISVPFITKLLEITGPLDLPDYKDRISATNFFAKSFLYTQTDFFPGSTQKKDFLGSLSSALLTRITTTNSLSVSKLFSVISDALDGKDIQLYVKNPEVSSVLKQWGWSGGGEHEPCIPESPTSPCTTEYVKVIEANLGVNKVNYFIKRTAASRITVSDSGTIAHELTYSLTNTSSANIQEGGGVYRAYIRVYFPQYTNLQSIEIDGSPVGQKGKTTTTGQSIPYYEVTAEGDSMVVGIFLPIDPLTIKKFVVRTTRSSALSFTKNASMTIAIDKQAGIETIPWVTTVNYPSSWNAVTSDALAKQGELEYNTTLGKDVHMSVVFEKRL